ncbi:MAG: hypothetical protein J3R72DRAFT_435990 [Linnemannia gamsii]|nr:MAG: hypothetical protein J3R72DRAFT_435990 [Linnemannia gamsii]
MAIALATPAIGVALALPPPPPPPPEPLPPQLASSAQTCSEGIPVCCTRFSNADSPAAINLLGPNSKVPDGSLGTECSARVDVHQGPSQ